MRHTFWKVFDLFFSLVSLISVIVALPLIHFIHAALLDRVE